MAAPPSPAPRASATPRTTPTSYDGPLLTLIRHGETEANVAHVLQGQTDSSLTVRGRAQVLALGRAWRLVKGGQGGGNEGQGDDGLVEEDANEAVRGQGRQGRPRCVNGLRAPDLVVASPTGRARTTASSIVLHLAATRSAHQDEDSQPRFDADGMLWPALESVRVLERASSRKVLIAAQDTDTDKDARITPALVLDPLLMEQNFGPLEGTRHRARAPGFEVPSSSLQSRSESRETFGKRVLEAGLAWLDAVGMGGAVNRFGRPIHGDGGRKLVVVPIDEAARKEAASLEQSVTLATDQVGRPRRRDDDLEDKNHRGKRARLESSCSTSTPPSTQPEDAPPHIVLVTHGLFISSFLNTFQPALDRGAGSSTGSKAGSSSMWASSYPFATNTGSFTLGIRPVQRLKKVSTSSSQDPDSTAGPASEVVQELFVLRANDTAHLSGLGSLGRGSPKKEKGLQTITSFFAKSGTVDKHGGG